MNALARQLKSLSIHCPYTRLGKPCPLLINESPSIHYYSSISSSRLFLTPIFVSYFSSPFFFSHLLSSPPLIFYLTTASHSKKLRLFRSCLLLHIKSNLKPTMAPSSPSLWEIYGIVEKDDVLADKSKKTTTTQASNARDVRSITPDSSDNEGKDPLVTMVSPNMLCPPLTSSIDRI